MSENKIEKIDPDENQGKRADQIEFAQKVVFYSIIIVLIVIGVVGMIS